MKNIEKDNTNIGSNKTICIHKIRSLQVGLILHLKKSNCTFILILLFGWSLPKCKRKSTPDPFKNFGQGFLSSKELQECTLSFICNIQ
ncbi:hypothetical protein DsansV1_C25g0187531 [Dioscorea sansibarensis]